MTLLMIHSRFMEISKAKGCKTVVVVAVSLEITQTHIHAYNKTRGAAIKE